jgi:hypothetical protein
MVARGISNASNTLSPEQTAYTNEIIRNRDHVDDTVKNFLKELEEKAKSFGKTGNKIEDAKTTYRISTRNSRIGYRSSNPLKKPRSQQCKLASIRCWTSEMLIQLLLRVRENRLPNFKPTSTT